MSPKKKIGKTKRSNRAVNTPTRFKDSASIEGTPHGTPTRGHGSADVDRNTDIVTKSKRERPNNSDENGTTFQTFKKGVSSGHIDLFYTPLESS